MFTFCNSLINNRKLYFIYVSIIVLLLLFYKYTCINNIKNDVSILTYKKTNSNEPIIDNSTVKIDTRSIININNATKDELIKVNGIGEATADKIIKYRQEHGKFEKTEDIMNVKGIGSKKYRKIKKYIEV